jgi:hypothetical protein
MRTFLVAMVQGWSQLRREKPSKSTVYSMSKHIIPVVLAHHQLSGMEKSKTLEDVLDAGTEVSDRKKTTNHVLRIFFLLFSFFFLTVSIVPPDPNTTRPE